MQATTQQLIPWIVGAGGALVLSAAARALPEPKPMGSPFYEWFYRFTHIILANFDKAGSVK
jgi:hypothetical protein